MPPQSNNAQSTPPPHATFSFDALMKNKKFTDTVKTFMTYGTIVGVIDWLIGYVVSRLSWTPYYMGWNSMGLIGAIIGGLIGGIISGLVFFYFYEPVHNWVKRTPFLAKHIHDIFTLFWKPFLVGVIISALAGLAGMFTFFMFFVGWLIIFAAHVALFYWYAKKIAEKLSPLYPW